MFELIYCGGDTVQLGDFLELIGKRWDILVKLSERKFYVVELAKELGKHVPQISKELKELEKNGLVEWEQKEGERLKYYHVSNYAKKILTAIMQTTESKPKERLEKWKIDEFLSILEDQDLSDDLRLSYSEGFHDICCEHPEAMIGNVRVQKLLEKTVADPLQDKVTVDLKRSVSAILPHTSCSENGRKWVLEKLYPIFVENMENKNEEIRVWATRNVGGIVSLKLEPSLEGEAEDRFLEIWFSNETDPDSELGKEVKLQMVGLASKRLFENVRARAKKQEDKVKAEILLERLKECLKPT